MKSYTYLPFLIFTGLLFLSCESKNNLPIERASKIYVDLMVVEEIYTSSPQTFEEKKDSIFSYYSVNEKKYREIINNLNNEEDWNKFFEFAQSYLDSLKTAGVTKSTLSVPKQP